MKKIREVFATWKYLTLKFLHCSFVIILGCEWISKYSVSSYINSCCSLNCWCIFGCHFIFRLMLFGHFLILIRIELLLILALLFLLDILFLYLTEEIEIAE